jgi:hypothetical protein
MVIQQLDNFKRYFLPILTGLIRDPAFRLFSPIGKATRTSQAACKFILRSNTSGR